MNELSSLSHKSLVYTALVCCGCPPCSVEMEKDPLLKQCNYILLHFQPPWIKHSRFQVKASHKDAAGFMQQQGGQEGNEGGEGARPRKAPRVGTHTDALAAVSDSDGER